MYTLLVYLLGSKNNETVIQSYLDNNLQKYGLDQNDVEEWIVKSETYSEKSETTHLYLQQTYHRIPIFGAVAKFLLKMKRFLTAVSHLLLR